MHNCALWIGITDKHIKKLQKFDNKFVKRVHLPHSHRLSLIGKLNFVRQILSKDNENKAKHTLQQEKTNGLNGYTGNYKQ